MVTEIQIEVKPKPVSEESKRIDIELDDAESQISQEVDHQNFRDWNYNCDH